MSVFSFDVQLFLCSLDIQLRCCSKFSPSVLLSWYWRILLKCTRLHRYSSTHLPVILKEKSIHHNPGNTFFLQSLQFCLRTAEIEGKSMGKIREVCTLQPEFISFKVYFVSIDNLTKSIKDSEIVVLIQKFIEEPLTFLSFSKGWMSKLFTCNLTNLVVSI